MEDPTQSVLWGDNYFGNGDGVVVSGPFRAMRTILGGPIIRNYGTGQYKGLAFRILPRLIKFNRILCNVHCKFQM